MNNLKKVPREDELENFLIKTYKIKHLIFGYRINKALILGLVLCLCGY